MSRLSNVIMSILFLSGKPVEEAFIREKLEISAKDMKTAVNELQQLFGGESGINLLRFNGKLQFATNPDYVHEVEAVLNPIKEKELTNAMLETLAIIAYKQPVTRLEVEEVRAVDCTYAVQNLTRLGLIEAVGRKDTIGKPLLFATTDEFLKRFSIGDVTELPDYESLLEKLKEISYGGDTEAKPMFDTAAVDAQLGEASELDADSAATQAAPVDEVVADPQTSDNGEKVEETSELAEDLPKPTRHSKRKKKNAPPDDDGFPDEEIPDFLKGEDVDVVE